MSFWHIYQFISIQHWVDESVICFLCLLRSKLASWNRSIVMSERAWGLSRFSDSTTSQVLAPPTGLAWCLSLPNVEVSPGFFSTGTFHTRISTKKKMWKASQSHFAVIVWRKPDWSVLNWIRCSETAVTTLYGGPEASPRPRIGCEILLFPPLEAGIASFPRALRLEKGARKDRMWPRAGRRDYLMGIKCPWWSHLKAPLACRAFVCVLKLCLENDLLLIFISFFFFSPRPHTHTPRPFLSPRVTTVKYQSMLALVSPALMEEHATSSPDSRSISGTTKIINNCLTVLRYTSEVFLYWEGGKKRFFRRSRFHSHRRPPKTQPTEEKKRKTSLCVLDLSLPFAALNIENQIRVDTLSRSSLNLGCASPWCASRQK